jgi:hypothetical protein
LQAHIRVVAFPHILSPFFCSRPFPQTINIIEESKILDFELLGLLGIGIALLVLVGHSALQFARSKGWVKKAKKSKTTGEHWSGHLCNRLRLGFCAWAECAMRQDVLRLDPLVPPLFLSS